MSDAQYVIDVAAQMSGGAQTVAQLDALSSTLVAAGVSADNLQDAVALASNALTSAKASSAEANAALAAGTKQFADLEQAAVQAGRAQEKAAKLGVVPPETAAALAAANAALAEQTTVLGGLEKAAAAAAANEATLSQTLASTKVAAAAGTAALAQQSAAEKALAAEAAKTAATAKKASDTAASDAKRDADAAAAEVKAHEAKSLAAAKESSGLNKVFKLQEALSTSNGAATVAAGAAAAATTAFATALVAVAVVLAAATIAVTVWAVGLADSRREATLTAQAAAALDPQIAALQSSFAGLTAETGAGASDLAAWTKQLEASKISAANLPAALHAVAQADAALGKGQGLTAFQDQLKTAHGSVKAVASTFDKDFGGIVAARMKGLTAQSAKLQANIGDLFGDLNIDPVLSGFQTLVSLFDESTAAGQSMKFLFESVFQPLIDQAQNAAYVIEGFVLGFLIGMTKVYIALKPAIKAVEEFFGFNDTSLSDVLAVATKAGEYAAYIFVGFVAALVAVGAIIGVVIAAAVAFQVAIYAAVAAVVAASVAIAVGFYEAWTAVWNFLTALPGQVVQIGANIMQGLADGITGAAGAVVGAITGAVSGAIDSAKKLLGIHSPSTVFADIGGYTGEGFVQGVNAASGDAQEALANMVAPPDTSSPGITGNFGASNSAAANAAGGGAGGRGSGSSILGSNNTFIFQGVADAEQAEHRFEEMLTRVLEGDASSLQPTAAPT